MKFTTVALSALVAGFATAQYGGIPSCATACVNQLLPKSCNNDVTCICTYPNFISDISCCVSTACPVEQQEQALNTARQLCGGANVVLPSAAGCSSSASSTATSSSTPSSSSTGSAGTQATTTSAGAAASPTNAAGKNVAMNGMGLAGVIVGAVALL